MNKYATFWTGVMVGILLWLVLMLLNGCSATAIYVPPGNAVQLRSDITNAKVWIKTKEGKTEPAIMTIPTGWYCLSED